MIQREQSTIKKTRSSTYKINTELNALTKQYPEP